MPESRDRYNSDWTIDTLHVYMSALREADKELQGERDRRYAEVAQEKEKALRIKEQADRDALELAREIQKYKDEKANELREQINRERLLYATKDDVAAAVSKLETALKPLNDFAATAQGTATGRLSQQQLFMVIVPGLVLSLLTITAIIVAVAYAIRK